LERINRRDGNTGLRVGDLRLVHDHQQNSRLC
jgi:hypothetical protein